MVYDTAFPHLGKPPADQPVLVGVQLDVVGDCLDADQVIEDYRRLIRLAHPEVIPYPDRNLVRSSRHRDPPRGRPTCTPLCNSQQTRLAANPKYQALHEDRRSADIASHRNTG